MIAAWMAYAVVVSIPVAVAVVAIASLLRRHGRAERGVWLGGLALTLLLPGVAMMPEGLFAPATPAPVRPIPLSGLPDVVPIEPSSALLGFDGPLLIVWGAVSGLLALRLLGAVVRLVRARRSWTQDHMSGESVLVSSDVGPAVVGLLRPQVVVPAWMKSLPSDQLDLVMQHEKEHIRRRDPWLLAVGVGARVVLPWHPAVWFLTAGLREALEIDCDRRVTRSHSDVARYGETVLTVAARLQPRRARLLPAFTESTSFIKRRLIAMTQPQRTLGRLGLAAVATLGVLGLAGACEVPLPLESDKERMEEVEIPVDASLVDADLEFGDAEREMEAEIAAAEREAVIAEARREVAEAEEATRSATEREPSFQPFTVAPSILNRSEMVQAMESEYPEDLRELGIGGRTQIYVFVTEEGVVSDVRIDESSGNEKLDRAALAVAARFEFSPALNEEEPVAVWISFPITFQVR